MKAVDQIHQTHKEMNTTITITIRMSMEQIELAEIMPTMETEANHCNRQRCFEFIYREITSNKKNEN